MALILLCKFLFCSFDTLLTVHYVLVGVCKNTPGIKMVSNFTIQIKPLRQYFTFRVLSLCKCFAIFLNFLFLALFAEKGM